MTAITYSCHPATPEETASTVEALRAHTESCIGVKVTHQPVAFTAYENGQLVGSIIGKIYSGWMHLELVWVKQSHRGRGIGRSLIRMSIEEATRQNLRGIEVWSQSWQAPQFYLHSGFTQYAVLDDFLPGHKRHVMRYVIAGATS